MAMLGSLMGCESESVSTEMRPNIVFAIADDWGWPDAGVYGLPVVQTPTFDRLAENGILFNHAYVSSPSCTPSRSSILTGRHFWSLGTAANLYGDFPDSLTTYQEILEQAGYETGWKFKGWGPGVAETEGRDFVGKELDSFEEFIEQRDSSKPFSFWLGSGDPHRGYRLHSGEKSGMDLDSIRVPADFPNTRRVRGDIADYLWEVQRFDTLLTRMVETLERIGELDNTLIVITGDHGMPFPRHKGNLYDRGTRVPLLAHWPNGISKKGNVNSFVSLIDLAPSFLEIASLPVPIDMHGKSLTPLFSGDDYEPRPAIHFGRERHVVAQAMPDSGGYPMRGIRTEDFLYIQNFKPDRWPAGTGDYKNSALLDSWYGDVDNGPTKDEIIDRRSLSQDDERLFLASLGKRPTEELYDLRSDPDQLVNLAKRPDYAVNKKELQSRLHDFLRSHHDPRILGQGDFFDGVKYTGGAPTIPNSRRSSSL